MDHNYDETAATLVPSRDDGLLTLEEFVEKAKKAIEEMPESWAECTDGNPEEPRSLDDWMEDLQSSIHNS